MTRASLPRRLATRLLQLVYGWDVFISYSRADATAYAEALRTALRSAGTTAFLDTRELGAGDALTPRLRRAARRCDVMATLVTPGATVAPRWILAELAAARDSRLGPRYVPVAVPPAKPGELGTAFADLNDALGVVQDLGGLETGAPDTAVVAAILQALGRRRLKRRRIVAVAALVAVVSTVGLFQWRRLVSARRDLAAQRWQGKADASATRARYDVAEYAAARALETGGGDRAQLMRTYREYRAHRRVEPVATFALRPDQRVVGARAGESPALAIADDMDIHVVVARGANVATGARHVTCPAAASPVACGGQIYIGCDGAIATWGRDDQVVATPVAGAVRDLRCDGDIAVALVATDGGTLAVVRGSDGWSRQVAVGREGNAGAGLCDGGGTWAAAVRGGSVFIERRHDGTVDTRDVGDGVVIATTHAAPTCDWFFINHGSEVRDPLQPLGATSPGWTLLEWPLAVARALPPDLVEVVPAAMRGHTLGLGRNATGNLLAIPAVDALVQAIEPRHLASEVADVTAWPPDAAMRTLSLEDGLLTIRVDGALDSRVAIGIRDPMRIRAWPDAVVVESATAVQVFAVAAPPPVAPPPSSTIASQLGLTSDDLVLSP